MLACNKLCRGEFSNSARVTSFLSTASRFQVVIVHIMGSANLPSNYAGRNPVACQESNCQVCTFASEPWDINCPHPVSKRRDRWHSVYANHKLSFMGWHTTRFSWLTMCTRPQHKATSIPDVKWYLQVATIAPDGLLVVKENSPFPRCVDCIIAPKQILLGLLTALLIKFHHPST